MTVDFFGIKKILHTIPGIVLITCLTTMIPKQAESTAMFHEWWISTDLIGSMNLLVNIGGIGPLAVFTTHNSRTSRSVPTIPCSGFWLPGDWI